MKSGLQQSGFWNGEVSIEVVLTYPRAVDVCGDGVDVDESAPGGDE